MAMSRDEREALIEQYARGPERIREALAQGAEGGAAVAPGAGEVERPRGGGPLRRLGDERGPAHPLP